MHPAQRSDRRPPEPVRRPVMFQTWSRVTFLHWAYPASTIRALVPAALEIDLFEGRAWVTLTPFWLRDLRAPGIPALPWISSSPETNVRTYVRGPDGRPGIWFFSLDFARLPAVGFARAVYRLPYMWSRMGLHTTRKSMRYRGRRRWGGPPSRYDIEVEPVRPLAEPDVSPLDNFLTARWILFTFLGRALAAASVEHPPWPLWSVRVRHMQENLLAAAGIPAPEDAPHAHFSPGVRTRIGAPHVVGVAPTR
jgi:uncharacterized protein